MKWLTIGYIKQHSRIDYDCEDALLELYADSAEDTTLNQIGRTYEEVLEIWGEIPAPLREASLMLVETSYDIRTPVSQVNMSSVPYTFDYKIAKYKKLTY